MKCPKCGKEIERLKKIVIYEIEVHEEDITKEKTIRVGKEIDRRIVDVYYHCYECDAIITDIDRWAKMIVEGREKEVYEEWNK